MIILTCILVRNFPKLTLCRPYKVESEENEFWCYGLVFSGKKLVPFRSAELKRIKKQIKGIEFSIQREKRPIISAFQQVGSKKDSRLSISLVSIQLNIESCYQPAVWHVSHTFNFCWSFIQCNPSSPLNLIIYKFFGVQPFIFTNRRWWGATRNT